MKKINIFLSIILVFLININVTNSEKTSQKEVTAGIVNTCKDKKNCNRQTTTTNSSNLVCSTNYSPICWEIDWVQKTYTNSCFLSIDKATYKYPWSCWNKIKNTTSSISNKNKLEVSKKEKDKIDKNKEPYLNFRLKVKVNRILLKLTRSLDKSNMSNFKKKQTINKIISRLNNIKKNRPKIEGLINYIIYKLNKYIS